MIIETENDGMAQQLAEKQFSNQTLRILSALGLIPIVITLIKLGSPYFDILAIAVAFMLINEWSRMSIKTPSSPFPYLICILTLGILYFDFSLKRYLQYTLSTLFLFSIFHFTQRRLVKDFVFHIIGLFYISWSIYLIIYLAHEGLTLYFIWILAVVWASDTGAYFVGKNVGGSKLAPNISPNKTWSGFIGGIIASMVIGTTLGYYLQDLYSTWLQMAVVSFYLSFMSHLGDLLESIVKRYFNVKDSGCLIPGHGGFLDRLDSTLLASFAAGLLLMLGI